MVLYGDSKLAKTVKTIAKIAINTTLPMLVSYFFCYFKMQVVILDSFFEITQTVITIAKIAISTTLPMLVSYLFSYFKM